MELHEYLDTLSEQIRCKKACPMIIEEIENHIHDQFTHPECSGSW